MYLTMEPPPQLRPFIARLWTNERVQPADADTGLEAILPSGVGHLAIRLADQPFRIADDRSSATMGPMVACGPRSRPYRRLQAEPVISVGAQLRPGMGPVLFGMPADEMAECHLPLADLWGGFAYEMQERLAEAPDASARLTLFARLLTGRLRQAQGMHPAVARGLHRFSQQYDVASVVREVDYSHRHFNALFRQAVGLSPKRYMRLQRFRRAVEDLAARPELAPAAVALDNGYSDQAHFNRDFREFAHMTPGRYRRAGPRSTFHVPLDAQDGQ